MSDANESASSSSTPLLSREELVVLVSRAHHGSSNEESIKAGRALADRSELPPLVAQNLGAGFGQWDFFPEPGDIVDFALAYKRPGTEQDVWAIARAWASDDAAGRHTLLALAGRDVLQHELRRIEIAPLRAVIDEVRPARARELRQAQGLEVAALPTIPTKAGAAKPVATKAAAPAVARKAPAAPGNPADAKADAPPAKMPKPAFKRPAPPAPLASARRFQHPKFGAGVLEAQSGAGEEAKLTIKFEGGSKTLLAKYVTELT